MSQNDGFEHGFLMMNEGRHRGLRVSLWTGEDGAPVVQIDTPHDTDSHEDIRVYLNDSIARRWESV